MLLKSTQSIFLNWESRVRSSIMKMAAKKFPEQIIAYFSNMLYWSLHDTVNYSENNAQKYLLTATKPCENKGFYIECRCRDIVMH